MDDTHLPGIYLFLAKYYLDKDLESATIYASKCTDYESVSAGKGEAGVTY